MTDNKPNRRYRSSETGRFVSKAFALLNKATTYFGTMARRKKKEDKENK